MLTVTLGLKVSKFFKSEQVELYSSILEPINLKLRLGVFNVLLIFKSHWDFRDALRRKSLCFFPAYFTIS